MKVKEIERLAVMETEIKNINDKLDDHVIEQREDFKTLYEKIDELKEGFAGKWVEKGFWIIMGTMVTCAISIIISMI